MGFADIGTESAKVNTYSYSIHEPLNALNEDPVGFDELRRMSKRLKGRLVRSTLRLAVRPLCSVAAHS